VPPPGGAIADPGDQGPVILISPGNRSARAVKLDVVQPVGGVHRVPGTDIEARRSQAQALGRILPGGKRRADHPEALEARTAVGPEKTGLVNRRRGKLEAFPVDKVETLSAGEAPEIYTVGSQVDPRSEKPHIQAEAGQTGKTASQMKARGDDGVQLKADPIAVQVDIERCGQGGEPQMNPRAFSPKVHIQGNLGDQGNPGADIESAGANGEIEQSKAEISAVIEGGRSDAGGIGILPLLGRV
jgi:hypothetical protein